MAKSTNNELDRHWDNILCEYLRIAIKRIRFRPRALKKITIIYGTMREAKNQIDMKLESDNKKNNS